MKRKHTRIHSSSLPKKSSTLFYTKWSFIAAISILKSFYLLHKYYKCHTAVCTQPQVTFHYHKIKIFASKKVVLDIKFYCFSHRSLPQADLWILLSLSQINLVDKKILVSEWICIGNGVITSVDKRPKNRLQLILIIHKKYLES